MRPSDALVVFEWFATLGAATFLGLCAWINCRARDRRSRDESAATGLEQLFAWIAGLAGDDGREPEVVERQREVLGRR